MAELIITPKTKIFDLLEAYPQLEDMLIGMVPQFRKLKNPILRKTITRITTLNQAATIGELNVEELINKLRKEVGQSTIDTINDTENINTKCPDWFSELAIVHSIDIRDMLHEGEQPVHEVMAEIKKLSDKAILKVIAPFVPAPLIDKSLSLGFKHWLDKKNEQEFFVYFIKG